MQAASRGMFCRMSPEVENHEGKSPIAVIINGPSSSGKSTLSKALLERLTDLADGDPHAAFVPVAFDDMLVLVSDKLYPINFVKLQDGDLSRLISREPNDGRAAWEYADESEAPGKNGGSPRVRLVLSPFVRNLVSGVHRGWGAHLELGTNLVIDHFLQDSDWCEEMLEVLDATGCRQFFVGVYCAVEELERREVSRSDGQLEVRPLGLARRGDELVHSHGLDYDVIVHSDVESTEESVESILSAMRSGGYL